MSRRFFLNAAMLALALATAAGAASAGPLLRIEVQPRFAGHALNFDALTNRTEAGQRISVTRLDFLVSDVALRDTGGAWLELTNRAFYVGGRDGRTHFDLRDFPAGRYQAIRFHIGLTPGMNHKNPSGYPAADPLNPDVNGLYWGWSGEYVFFAIEGRWSNTSNPGLTDAGAGGYSFHIATDRQLMTVELPVTLNLLAGRKLVLGLTVDRIFSTPNLIVLRGASVSTHSRAGDGLAGQLKENIEHAFSVEQVLAEPDAPPAPAALPRVEIASDATPYPFVMPSTFPRPALPADNPLTREGVELGRRLFFDRQLSANGSQSCASCHQPGSAFAQHEKVSTGAKGQSGVRNAMSLFNLAWKSSFFWDGRAATLREQVLMPIQNPSEMDESLTNLIARLRTGAGASATNIYPALFGKAFGTPEITSDRIARALEQFLLTKTSFDSKFDRVMSGQGQFTVEEQHGFELFFTEYDPSRRLHGADCFHCHGGPLFRSQSFANNGLDAIFKDRGRGAVTGKPGDDGKFAVPSLRNVELTGPYMHDGRFETLEDVVEHYSTGVKRSPTLDPNLAKHPDGGVPLTSEDKKALVAFLKTLTDERLRADPTLLGKAQ